jgi:hypothetical protein
VSIKEQEFNFDKDVSSIDFHLQHISFRTISQRDVKCATERGCLKSNQDVRNEVLNMQNNDYAVSSNTHHSSTYHFIIHHKLAKGTEAVS